MTVSVIGDQAAHSYVWRPDPIESSDLLTWEIQLKAEGTLPPEIQRRLLEHVAKRIVPQP